MAQNQTSESEGRELPGMSWNSLSRNNTDRTCRDDSGDVCAICDGHGTVIVGEYDDTREVTCPLIRQARKERDLESRLDQYLEER